MGITVVLKGLGNGAAFAGLATEGLGGTPSGAGPAWTHSRSGLANANIASISGITIASVQSVSGVS